MDIPNQSRTDRYESFYREFDSPLMQKIRLETFGEDIGLQSWGSAQEMRADIAGCAAHVCFRGKADIVY